MSGLGKAATVALLNLSLVLALGSLSATPLGQSALGIGIVAAFIATSVGGLLVALIARAPAEIAGAASSTTIIYAALAADLVAHAGSHANVAQVWAALSVAVVLAGVLVVIAGYARFASAIKFMPAPVNAGFVTGLGLMVAWSQLGPLLGVEGRLWANGWSGVIAHVKPASAAVGLVTAFTVWGAPKLSRRAQPALVALAAGTAAYYLIASIEGPAVLGPTLGRIAPAAVAPATIASVWSFFDARWFFATAWYVAPYAAFLAFQIIMNTALGAAAVGAIRGTRSNVNRTLKTEGWVNVLCGSAGSLPVTTIGSIALPAARMGGVTPSVAAISCALLFTAVFVASDLLARIPVAVIAGILVMNGFAMIDRWALGLFGTARRATIGRAQVLWNLAIVGAVAGMFFLGSVPLALFVGAVMAMVLLALSLSEATTFESIDGRGLASTRVWPFEQAQWLAGERGGIAVFRPRGSIFFGTADQLSARLDAVETGVKFVVLDLSRVTTMDATGCQIVAAAAKKLAAKGVTTVLAGVRPSGARAQEWLALGLVQPDAKTHWFDDFDHALEWVELALLRSRWPATEMPAANLADTPLTQGLSDAEVAALKGYMRTVEVPAGSLFTRDDPGASMFVVDSGFVEIRIGDETAQSTRLAAFGPGSIFGEMAMMSGEARSADAVCLEATRLHELTRDSLMQLAVHSPALYTRVVENLNRHLANRLVISTSLVQARR
jgi:sulfate permease, SulP family